MTIEVRVPQLPESVADATLVSWHKQPGEAVARDENLVDLETDKVVLEVPAPMAGVISEIKFKDGATVTSGQLLALIEEAATVPGASAPAVMAQADGAAAPAQDAVRAAAPGMSAPASSAAEAGGKLSPAAKRVVEENKVDPKSLIGSGRDGRVSKSDVVNYLAAKDVPTAAKSSVATPATQPAAAAVRRSDGAETEPQGRPHRATGADDAAARAHCRAHGAGAVDPGAAHLVQRGRSACR